MSGLDLPTRARVGHARVGHARFDRARVDHVRVDSWLTFMLALALVGCAREARPTEPPPRVEVCALAEGRLSFAIPLGAADALAVAPDGCLFVDESAGVRVLSLVSLATDEEGAELLERDAEAFFRASGLLGDAPEVRGRGSMRLAGRTLPAVAWTATLPELGGPLHVTTGAYRRGGDWLVALVIHEPSDTAGARRLLDLAAELAPPSSP